VKNKSKDLNDHLFEAMEWLGDRDLEGEKLNDEIRRADAKCRVAQQIIANGSLVVAAARAVDGFIDKKTKLPPMLTG
jgi:hypothetical protein